MKSARDSSVAAAMASEDPAVEKVWVTRVVNAVGGALGQRSLVGSVVGLGLPPTLLLSWYLVTEVAAISPGFLVGCLSAIVFLNLVPYLVWRYDAVVYPRFFEQFSRAMDREGADDNVPTRFKRFFARRFWLFSLPTTLFGVPMMLGGRAFLRTQGVDGVGDPALWVLFVVVLWLGVLIGIGFTGVATTLLVVRAITSGQVVIDPHHPDGRGGMRAVGSYTVQTTVMFSMGSLLLPVQFHYVSTVGPHWLTGFIYLLVFVYAGAILLSFVYPIVQVTRRANEDRERQLDALRWEYDRTRARLEDTESTREATRLELKLGRLRQEHQVYSTVRLYPTRVSVISRAVGSVLLPLLFVVIDTLLEEETLMRLLESIP